MKVRLLAGLPPYEPAARAFPAEWGQLGREGIVAEFQIDGGTWVGNFRPGLGGLDFVAPHPNGTQAIVIARGDVWVVDPQQRRAECILPGVDIALGVQNPLGWVLSRQGLALVRLGPSGLLWHTRRLSWDGFDKLQIVGDGIGGLAWSAIDERWSPFSVDLRTGRSTGGSYSA